MLFARLLTRRKSGRDGFQVTSSPDLIHQFQEYTYKKITPCDVCSQVLRGMCWLPFLPTIPYFQFTAVYVSGPSVPLPTTYNYLWKARRRGAARRGTARTDDTKGKTYSTTYLEKTYLLPTGTVCWRALHPAVLLSPRRAARHFLISHSHSHSHVPFHISRLLICCCFFFF